jgi:hypothetical protein
MAINYKRKTPCANVKAGFKNLATTAITCHCCGDWARLGSRIVRNFSELDVLSRRAVRAT